jgi:demethylmenaquinone methyltransferase/2-methoxy-6-polyprenyl-1,4-benzoquinol methylase
MNTPPPPAPSGAETIDFGYAQVPRQDKARRVRGVFESVADKYDVMNDLMSMGIHRLWKRFLFSQTGLRPGQHALDVAGGTGDIAIGLAKQVGPQGRVVLSDINAAMLAHGRDRVIDALNAELNTGAARVAEWLRVEKGTTLPYTVKVVDCC